MNYHSTWLFPGTLAGQHISEQSLMQHLRKLGIVQASPNAAQLDLTKEHPTGQSDSLLGLAVSWAATSVPAFNHDYPNAHFKPR